MKLPLFNSPRMALCTCLPKYNLNTYLGSCAHGCIYCYATKFPSFVGPPLPRLNLLDKIEEMAERSKPKFPVMMSACTDPYQPLEREHEVTRRCAEVLAKHGFPLLMVTKSDLVTRDIEIFKRTPTVVAVTVNTLGEDIAGFIEPYAPPPCRRIAALRKIAGEGIATVARIDPIIPTVNDDEGEFEELTLALKKAGVRQVTVSTLKPVTGFFSALRARDREAWDKLRKIYADGRWVMGYKYLHEEKRRKILEKLRPVVLNRGLNFAHCREGFGFNTSLCDGTAYCRPLLSSFRENRG